MAPGELYRSPDGRVTVTETDGVVSLRFNGRLQSSMRGPGGLDTVQPYLDFLHLFLAVAPHARSMLLVGLGGGVFPKRVLNDYPDVSVDVAELDPLVVELARRFFALPDDERLRVTIGDGRAYLAETDRVYDVIVVDAYHEAAMPFEFATLEFMRLAASRLAAGGVLAFNVVGALEGEGAGTFARFVATVRAVFRTAYLFPVGSACGDRRQNIVVLASDVAPAPGEIRERVRGRVEGRVRVPGFEGFADHLVSGPPLEGVRPLADAEAPRDGMLDA